MAVHKAWTAINKNKQMKFKDLIKKIAFLISVPKCVGCKTRLQNEGSPLCPSCLEEYENTKQRNCSVCAKELSHCNCSNKYLESHYVKNIVKVFRYLPNEESAANNLIYSLKRDNRKDVLNFLSDELSDAIFNSYKNTDKFIFTNVPRRSEAIRKYGIDHSKLLAKALAKRCGGKYIQLLRSNAKTAQKKLLANERINNAKFDYRLRKPSLKGITVVLVDDIVTTGASMGACAMLLRGLGAKKIIGASISIAYKDKYIKFEKTDRYKRGNYK